MRYKYLVILSIMALAAFLCGPTAGFASILLSAEDFAVLAGTPNITNTGATTITGNVGIAPAASITGKETITFTGAPGTYLYYEADPALVALTAKNDLSTAYTALNNMPANGTLAAQLGGATLTSGVYTFAPDLATVLLDGILTLNAEGNNNAYWVFQIPYELTTGVGSSVVVENLGSNGGIDDGVFWVVGSSAGIFGSTSFEGNILAGASINLYNSATILNGRALAQTGTVTMDTNTISIICPNGGPGYSGGLVYGENGIVPIGPSQGEGGGGTTSPVPEPSTMLLFGLGGVATAFIRGRRKA